ncbi:MAG: hypothetical protein FWD69_14970 [Polyangiaceae bacterium]|nr:hypothetical protein [Polyangiaceae bacterium]
MRIISALIHVGPMALASAVGIGACATHGSDVQSETQPSENAAGQSLTQDMSCNSGAPGVLYSATWSGGADGILDLGNGGTATILNSDGVYFDWSATTPIAVVYVYGDARQQIVYSYDPAATQGVGLHPPRDPNNQDMQLPLYAIKFCFYDASVTTDAGTDTGTDAGTNTETDAGADSGGNIQQDAAPPPSGNNTW